MAHGGKVYRVGGLNILNETLKDKEDMHSTAEFSEFDPATKKWTVLAPLPAAVVAQWRRDWRQAIRRRRMCLTGRSPEGKSPGSWEPDALVYDFTKPEAGWQKLPLPEFKRLRWPREFGRTRFSPSAAWTKTLSPRCGLTTLTRKPANGTEGPKLPGARNGRLWCFCVEP